MNLVGGLALITMHPFDVGDEVSAPLIPMQPVRGRVVSIGLLSTQLLTSQDNTPVSHEVVSKMILCSTLSLSSQTNIPNRMWTSAICFNHSRAARLPPPSTVSGAAATAAAAGSSS